MRQRSPSAVRPWRLGARYVITGAAAAPLVLAVAASLAGPQTDRVDRAVLQACIVGVPLAVGLHALRSARTARFGMLLIAAGSAWSLTALAQSPESLPYSIGRVAAWLVFPALLYLMLSFPDGRVGPAAGRRLFGAACLLIALFYVGSALLVEAYPAQTPWATCEADCPPNAFLVLGAEPALMDQVIQPVRELLAIVLLLAVIASMAHRVRTAPPIRRRMFFPVMVVSAASLTALSAFLVARRVAPGAEAVHSLGVLWSATVPAIAAAFFVGLLRRRLFVGDALARLSLALDRRLDGVGLRAALASALDDPAVELLVPDGVDGGWRDTHGHVTPRSAPAAAGRAVTTIEDGGTPVAALVHDPALRDDDELPKAVCSLALTALRRERLTMRLTSSLAALEDSRKRIARAADLERSQIERDLHDGAQQRLVTLRITLALAEELLRSDPTAGAVAVHRLGPQIDKALDELRALAQGIYPSLLTDRGLEDALRGVALESPLAVSVRASGLTRLPKEVETAVYFTCLESVQNAVKHATAATGVWISLVQEHTLRFEILDDGAGFDPSAVRAEGGLRNMADRLEAVGGRLSIDSAPGRGTRVSGVVQLV